MSTGDIVEAGWVCQCGMYVPVGVSHRCQGWELKVQTGNPSDTESLPIQPNSWPRHEPTSICSKDRGQEPYR